MSHRHFFPPAIFLVLFLIIHLDLKAQSLPWYSINGHDPLRTIQINPAFQMDEKLKSAIHVGSINLDYNNNFGYFKDKSFAGLIFNLSEISVPELQYKKNGYNPLTGLDRDVVSYEMKFNESNLHKMYFSTGVSLMGPGFYKKLKNGIGIGLFTGLELHGGLNDFPSHTTYSIYRNYREGNQITVPVWNALSYGYFHVGLHGSKEFKIDDKSKLSVGANARYLGGLMYMSLSNQEYIDKYAFGKEEDIEISNLDLEYAFTHGTTDDISNSIVKGNGVGGDLGLYYSRNIESSRISFIRGGLAIRNLGVLKFNDNLRRGYFKVNGTTGISISDFDTIKSLDQFIDSAIVVNNRNPLNTYERGNGKTVFLPAELNLMLSTGFRNYARVHLYYSMPLSSLSPEGIQLGFVPELVLGKINVLVPFSYNNQVGFKLGIGLNVDFLTIGSDDIRSFYKRDRLQSGSIYMGVNVLKFVKKEKK